MSKPLYAIDFQDDECIIPLDDIIEYMDPYVLKGFHGRHHFEELLKAHELREDSI